MADDGAEDEVAASLARLRMFLAPHQPVRSAPEHSHESTEELQAHPQTRVDESTPAEADHIDSQNDCPEDLSGDLSTLAASLSSRDDEEMLCRATEAAEPTATMQAHLPMPQELLSAMQDEAEVCEPPAPPASAVASLSPISSLSKDHIRVKYLLQCSLPGFRVHDDLFIWDMKNPALVAQYEAHANGVLELDSWVEVEKLSTAMNRLQTNAEWNDDNAKKFSVGNIAIDYATATTGRKQLVLCKIAVGRSLPINGEKLSTRPALPPGYHSYYLHQGDATDASSSTDQRYRHEYILQDAVQVLPLYLVRFSYSAIKATAQHACALCETRPATVHCKVCGAKLCVDCDKEVHSANKLVERHKRTPLREQIAVGRSASGNPRRHSYNVTNQGSNPQVVTSEQMHEAEIHDCVHKQVEEAMTAFQGTCRLHEGKKIEFYCPVCATPVCVNCKMVGDHSIGDKGVHRLLPIADAYEQCLRESFKTDPLVDSRRSVIESKLAQIAQWEKDIERNRQQVEEAIKQQYEQALASLDAEVKKKACVLKGESLEFVRQLQQLDWLDDCLDERRAYCSVVEFLSTWNQHKFVRAEQRDFPVSSHTPLGGDLVKADLQLVGQLQVVAGEHGVPRLSFTGSDFGDLSQQEDRSGPLSPPASVRRSSDNELRRKLLSLRSVEKRQQESTSSASPSKASLAGLSTLSPEGRKMMEEIRNDLIARGTVRSAAGSGTPGVRSPVRSPLSHLALRMLPIQPAPTTDVDTTISAPPKQRTSTAAWTALLRHELAAAKEHRHGQ